MIDLFLNLGRNRKMVMNPLPNDRAPKQKKKRRAAVIKTLFPRINVEDELCSSILNSHSRR